MTLTNADMEALGLEESDYWTRENSPFISMHDRTRGGLNVLFLGSPGAGKTWSAYMRAYALLRRERLWIRGLSKNHVWHWRFKRRAVVWVPEGATFKLNEARIGGGPPVPCRIETYRDFKDLLTRARLGDANVLYWAEDGLEQWVAFLHTLNSRADREPQVVLDDELQNVAPQGASQADGAYRRMIEFRRWMQDARESRVSSLLCTQIDFQIDYNSNQLAHYYVILQGAKVPPTAEEGLPRGPDGKTHIWTSQLTEIGDAVVVGATPRGKRYQVVNFRIKRKGDYQGPYLTTCQVEGIPKPESPPEPALPSSPEVPSVRLEYTCQQCNYSWESRIVGGGQPKKCPHCNSWRWAEGVNESSLTTGREGEGGFIQLKSKAKEDSSSLHSE